MAIIGKELGELWGAACSRDIVGELTVDRCIHIFMRRGQMCAMIAKLFPLDGNNEDLVYGFVLHRG